METFKVGDRVVVTDKVSVDSYVLYKQYKDKYSFIVCPCNIKPTDRLVVKFVLGKKGLLLNFEGKENVVTLIMTKDVKKVRK